MHHIAAIGLSDHVAVRVSVYLRVDAGHRLEIDGLVIGIGSRHLFLPLFELKRLCNFHAVAMVG